MTFKSLIALGAALAIVALPLPEYAMAQQASAVSDAALQQVIAAAAREASSKPGFQRLKPAQKLAAIQAAVAAALAKTGASPQQIATALINAVAANIISAGVAVSIAAAIAPDMAQQVASSPVVMSALRAEGQSVSLQTASTGGLGGISVLVNLQGAVTGGGGTSTPTPYDPCAGVIATYCGS